MLKRENKQEIVEQMHTAWAESSAGMVAHYRGLSVTSMGELRRVLHQADLSLQVVKNTLARRAIADTGFAVVEDLFTGPTAVAFGNDPAGLAKALFEFSEKNEALTILGGVLDGKRLEQDDIKVLASLPSREVLLAKLLGSMNAPIGGFVRTLNEVPASFVRTLAAVRDQKQAA